MNLEYHCHVNTEKSKEDYTNIVQMTNWCTKKQSNIYSLTLYEINKQHIRINQD